MNIIEVKDKTGRIIHLANERWSHIRKKHPEVEDIETIKDALNNPDKIEPYDLDETIHYYYKYTKNRKSSAKNLLVIVKYLNGEGFVVSAYFKK